MSTKGTLGFALAAAIFMAGVIALGLPLVASALAIGTAAVHGLLLAFTRATTASDVAGREPWERRAVIALMPTVAAGIVVASLLVCLHVDHSRGGHLSAWHALLVLPTDHTEWWWRLLLVTYASATATFYLSSLVDWTIVVPRLRGLGPAEKLPCRTSTAAEWKTLTQVWMAHRIAAYVVLRIALGISAVVLVAALRLALPPQAVPAFATVIAALIVYLLNRHASVTSLTSNPSLHVGDRIILAEEFGTGTTNRPSYYVLDVALEGVGLVELRSDGSPVHAVGNCDARIKDRTLDLKDINRLLRGRHPFRGCATECCGANKHCPKTPGDSISRRPPAPSDPPA